MKYYSRVSISLSIFIAACFLISIAPVFYYDSNSEDMVAALLSGFSFVPIMIGVYFSTYYTINGNTLTVKSCLLVNERIDIMSIKSIMRSNSLLSAPAISLKRIAIKYGRNKTILISPKHQSEFLKQLKAINPNIEIADNLFF